MSKATNLIWEALLSLLRVPQYLMLFLLSYNYLFLFHLLRSPIVLRTYYYLGPL